MIFLIISWVILIIICSIGGHAVIALMKDIHLLRRGDRVILSVWIGLVPLCWILLGLSLFMPLNATAGMLAAVPNVVVGLSVRRARQLLIDSVFAFGWAGLAGSIVLAVAVAFSVAVQTVTHADTGLYHYQSVRWFAEFGAVHGLALVNTRLGFVSAWFSLVAPFDWNWFQGHIGVLPGGFALFLILTQLMLIGRRLLTGRTRPSDWFAGVALSVAAVSSFVARFPQSLSPDMAVMTLAVIVCWLMLVISDVPRSGVGSNNIGMAIWRDAIDVRFGAIILASGALLIKPNAAPICIISGLFYWLTGAGGVRRFLVGLCVGLIVVAPFVAVTIVRTGCIAYPAPSLCLPVAWSPRHEVVSRVSDAIPRWGQWRGLPSPADAGQWDWVGPWIRDEKNFVPIFLIGTSLLALLVIDPKLHYARIRWPLALSVAGLGFVLLTTWNVRFALGYVASFPGLVAVALQSRWPLAAFVSRFRPKGSFTDKFGFPLVAIAVSLVLTIGATLYEATSRDPRDIFFIPPLLPVSIHQSPNQTEAGRSALAVTQKTSLNFSYYVPTEGIDCWDAPLPCTELQLWHIRLRNPETGFAGGFERR